LSAQPVRIARGCFLTSAGFEAYRAQGRRAISIQNLLFDGSKGALGWTTGRPDIDRELDSAIKIAARILEVTPAFTFYDVDRLQGHNPAESLNAFASQQNVVPGTRGVVGFGDTLFRSELYGHDESGTSVMCVIAHEFGHVLQSYLGYLNAISGLQCENNADFLAGYYLGVRKQTVRSLNFQVAADLFARIGRPGNGNPSRDHGNSQERVEASEAGFRAGSNQKNTLKDAVRAGWELVGYKGNG
jgi:hypothetical protein